VAAKIGQPSAAGEYDPAMQTLLQLLWGDGFLSPGGAAVAPGPLPVAEDSLDVVFSKDAIVQIPDKVAVFADAYRLLCRGGSLIVSDWLRGGSGSYSDEMLEFFRLEGIAYNMADITDTTATLARVGFIEIEARDRNEWYRDLARRELAALEGELRPAHIKARK